MDTSIRVYVGAPERDTRRFRQPDVSAAAQDYGGGFIPSGRCAGVSWDATMA
jgi:hypothetical protein